MIEVVQFVKKGVIAFFLIHILVGCRPFTSSTLPKISFSPPQHRLEELPSSFPALSEAEYQKDWANEILIGNAFAREFDFYRAITAYKRALFLLPKEESLRRGQVEFGLIFSYYLGQKPREAINFFEQSSLRETHSSFPAFKNLLLILYDAYLQIDQLEKASLVLNLIERCSSETAEDLSLYYLFKKGEVSELEQKISTHRFNETLEPTFILYKDYAKSPRKARILNGLLPGAGYAYVGQFKSGVTSFVINSLFTAAAYQFFRKGYIAAGAITTSLEFGWYFGGINGAGLEAEEFNRHLYEGVAKKAMIDHALFPIFMFETSF